MSFESALHFTLSWEGGYVNHPDDPGGETNFGISKRAYPNEDIVNMTIERASEIYKRDYWDKCSCDLLPNKTATVVFDLAVNSGTKRARKALQEAAQTEIDGAIGPNTLSRVARYDDTVLARKVLMIRVKFLCLLARKKSNIYFIHGWMRRTHSLMGNIYAAD
jgi:lysozyme family protein